MSLLASPSFVHSSALRPDELGDAFRAWAHGPAKPRGVDLGRHEAATKVSSCRPDADLPPFPGAPVPSTNDSKGHPDVR